MKGGKTIIISNRLPVRVELDGEHILYHDSEGGLATGLSSVYQDPESIWIGWSGIPTQNLLQQQRINEHLKPRRMLPVMLNEREVKEFYDGFSNETLWPLFHYFTTYATFDRQHWETYVAVNLKFAKAILEVAEAGDRIWIHDYHLLLVPSMVRDRMPEASIGFFQHIPFPTYEIFRQFPWKKELLQGLLGADLIGFHTSQDVDHFIDAVSNAKDAALIETSILSNEILIEDRSVTVKAFPMGIDYEKYRTLSCSPATIKVTETIHELVSDRKLMLSVDRLDYSKGILQRLKAYDLFLSQHPEFHEKLVFLQLIVPSRDNVSQYSALKEDIDRSVTDINSRYGSFDWEPIRYWYRSLSPETLSGLYVVADVALVTPLRDGMNLVSKEYVASKTCIPGVLILSEMAGAAQEMNQALIINPNDKQEFCDAMYTALIMPVREQTKRVKLMQQMLEQNNVHYWAKNFLATLAEIKSLQHTLDVHLYSNEMEEHMLTQFISRSDSTSLIELLKTRLHIGTAAVM